MVVSAFLEESRHTVLPKCSVVNGPWTATYEAVSQTSLSPCQAGDLYCHKNGEVAKVETIIEATVTLPWC